MWLSILYCTHGICCGNFLCWSWYLMCTEFLCMGGIDVICFFILWIQTIMMKKVTLQQSVGWQDTKVTPSFVIITTKFLSFPSQIRTSSPQWVWAHHQASAVGLKPRWWKTGCKMYDEAGGLWGIVLCSTVTIQLLADGYKVEVQICCSRIKLHSLILGTINIQYFF